MNAENLDALLIDRALGELIPEVSELLDTYLASNPTAAARVTRLTETTELARAALRDPVRSIVGKSPAPPWRGQAIRARLSTEWLRLAACVAIGLAAGWLVKPSTSSRREPLPAEPVVQKQESPRASSRGFWSVARMTDHAAEAPATDRAARPYRVTWNSPIAMPHFEKLP